MKLTARTGALLLVPALLLVGCSSSAETGSAAVTATTLDELHTAAQEEGDLVIYGPTEDLYAEVYADFAEAYPGVEITTSDIFGQELDARLEGELVAGNIKAGLLHIGVSDQERYNDKGYLASYAPIGIDGIPETALGPDDRWTVASQHVYSLVYNTDKLDPADAPTTWDDVLDVASDVAVSSPKQSGASAQVFAAALDADVIDEAWIDDFAAASPKVFPSSANALQATVTGETAITFGAGFGTYMRQVAQGAPLGFVALEDGTYFSDVGYGVVADSPAPNAARLLVSWMLTEEGQASIAEHVYEFGTMPGAPLPEGADIIGEPERTEYPGSEGYLETLSLLGEKF